MAADGVKCVVLSGTGPVFCSGHDLKEIKACAGDYADARKAFYEELFAVCSEVMTKLATKLDIPVIAQTHGFATAAGCQLAQSCDMVLSSSDCKFATPGVNIGLFCSTPSVALTRSVASKKFTNLMLYSGEAVST